MLLPVFLVHSLCTIWGFFFLLEVRIPMFISVSFILLGYMQLINLEIDIVIVMCYLKIDGGTI